MKILTFDIEEWFHILDNPSTKTSKEWGSFESRIHSNMDRIFSILEQNNVKATFFCLGWIAKKYPDIIKKIDALGYEIGTHSQMHQLAYEMSPKEFNDDLSLSINIIEDIIGKKVISYRAPGFSIVNKNVWAFESLIKNGIEIDCSVFPAKRAHGGLDNFESSKPCLITYNGLQIKEFPINLYSIVGKKIIFSGGGYFRLFPYKLINKLTKKSDYVMSYFHPRDFDYSQPMINDLSLFRKFKSYYGLKNCENKLNKWIKSNNFIDLNTANSLMDWDKVDTVSIM